MTTNGTGITREEAESILNMMRFSEAEQSSGSIAVLKKLQKAYPDLIPASSEFGKIIAASDAKAKVTKAEASKQISEKIEQVYALFEECEKIADKTGVSFTFDMNGTYGMGGTYREGEWMSSSDQC